MKKVMAQLTIKQLFIMLFTCVVVLVMMMGVVQKRLDQSISDLNKAYESRYISYQLADELRQSSDDLTRLARTYVLTGDNKYEEQYWNILDIRNGKKPRPESYSRIYWDFVAVNNEKPREDSKEQISLLDLMKKNNFTKAELDKLAEAAANSDGLVKIETIAMNARKDLVQSESGDFVKGKADLSAAREMMHSGKYHQEKAKIMKPIDDFYVMMDKRTNLAVEAAEQESAFYKGLLYTCSFVILGVLAGALWFAYAIIMKQLGCEPGVAAAAVRRIAEGDIHHPIISTSTDAGSVTSSLNTLQSILNRLVDSFNSVSQQHDKGDIDAEVDANQFKGAYASMATGVNQMVAGHLDMSKKALACVHDFGEGNLDARLEKFPGKKVFVNNAVEQVRTNIKSLITDTQSLSQAAIEGQLSARVDASKHKGDFRKIIEGINNTLDSFVIPIKLASGHMQDIATGNMPDLIVTECKGDFCELKSSLNQCIETVNALITDMSKMSEQHDQGNIDAFIDEDKFQGSYKLLAQNVNQMVRDYVELNQKTMDCVKGFGEGDFNAHIESFPGKKALINHQIEQVRSNLKALSSDAQMLVDATEKGHVKVRADINKHQGDFRELIAGINTTLDMVVRPIEAVKTTVETINTAINEITTGSNELARRTEEQTASLEETASSMEELASIVRKNSDNAKQANQLAMAASDVAIRGGSVVGQVVTTMSAINDSAHKIEDIITVIDGIAFQTNILALNAAVEAARAGEQGRGFAVVAGEVRNLAQRSASAAKEIKELISDSVTKTAEGTTLVEDAGKTMDEIVSSVQRVTDIMSEITAASAEQSSGIDQVKIAITTIDEATQQNASLVEEGASAAESLAEQAKLLSQAISVFVLDGGVSGLDRRSQSSPMRGGSRENYSKDILKKARVV